MTQRTAAHHCPSELAYLRADELLNVVEYTTPSASQPGSAHYVSLDILTGETLCTCKAAECHRECWHQTLAQAAWDGHSARVLVARYSDEQLAQAGRKVAIMCNSYRIHGGRPLPADQVALLACRAEYAARRQARAAYASTRVLVAA